MDGIGILVIDNDLGSQSVLKQILDSEGWRVDIASDTGQALKQLATGNWALVIASVALTGFGGPLYTTLSELAPAVQSGGKRLQVLFLVPESAGPQARAQLEAKRFAYVLKPFSLHDFLERVSDLLLEAEAIPQPIRRVRQEGKAVGRGDIRTDRLNTLNRSAGRNTGMFFNRADYAMTEEEIAEYEKQEAAEADRKKQKKLNSLE